jgi:hypothetical protein
MARVVASRARLVLPLYSMYVHRVVTELHVHGHSYPLVRSPFLTLVAGVDNVASVTAAENIELINLGDGAGHVLRVSFNDINAFMTAGLRPSKRQGWRGMCGGDQPGVFPLILAECPRPEHASELCAGLESLYSLTVREERGNFKNLWATLGMVLYSCDPQTLPSLASELKRYLPADNPDDVLIHLQKFPALRIQSQSQVSDGITNPFTIRTLEYRVTGGHAPPKSDINPPTPREVWRVIRANSPFNKHAVSLRLDGVCTESAVRERLSVSQRQRNNGFDLSGASGHVEDGDWHHDPTTFIKNLALRACLEFVEEVGSYNPAVNTVETREDGVYFCGRRVDLSGFTVRHSLRPLIIDQRCPSWLFLTVVAVRPFCPHLAYIVSISVHFSRPFIAH